MDGKIDARPTLYKGTRMRSRLEADYAAYLDRKKCSFEYEPECFGGPDGQWLPDFRYHEPPLTREPKYPGELVSVYTEIKPVSFADALIATPTGPGDFPDWSRRFMEQNRAVERLLERMSMAWLSDEDAVLQLVLWEFGADGYTAAIIGKDERWACFNFFSALWSGMRQGPPNRTLRKMAVASAKRLGALGSAVASLVSLSVAQNGRLEEDVAEILCRMSTADDAEFDAAGMSRNSVCHLCGCGTKECYVYTVSRSMERHWCVRCGKSRYRFDGLVDIRKTHYDY